MYIYFTKKIQKQICILNAQDVQSPFLTFNYATIITGKQDHTYTVLFQKHKNYMQNVIELKFSNEILSNRRI